MTDNWGICKVDVVKKSFVLTCSSNRSPCLFLKTIGHRVSFVAGHVSRPPDFSWVTQGLGLYQVVLNSYSTATSTPPTTSPSHPPSTPVSQVFCFIYQNSSTPKIRDPLVKYPPQYSYKIPYPYFLPNDPPYVSSVLLTSNKVINSISHPWDSIILSPPPTSLVTGRP